MLMVIALLRFMLIFQNILILHLIAKSALFIRGVPIAGLRLMMAIAGLMKFWGKVGVSITPDFCRSRKRYKNLVFTGV
ncbi:hypothetical protein LIP84_18400 [Roseburia faecis]|uniref:hypothetical protein n=1 Tax=Roseburia faecis TaxID=301302 RepID=UPI001D002053|nr:hypothetical protein [Roseburia faecis]MCB5480142.1 hypothetical protein [Roseburia faecis]